MHFGRRYSLWQMLWWSRLEVVTPLIWASLCSWFYFGLGAEWLALPWLPMSLIGIAVAFYLGFKNNASYDRLWEARKIWGGITNQSRSFVAASRDLLRDFENGAEDETYANERRRIVRRHIAWLDALRFQLRVSKSWEHNGAVASEWRRGLRVPELIEDRREELLRSLPEDEVDHVLSQLNPAISLLSEQSRAIGSLRQRGRIDGFSHKHLQELIESLVELQGRAERIKTFPFPRQYATVNIIFARLLVILIPAGMVAEFDEHLSDGYATLSPILAAVFSGVVSWVFLCAAKIGDWSENPFEGLPNDVPISAICRTIERESLQAIGETELPPVREPVQRILL